MTSTPLNLTLPGDDDGISFDQTFGQNDFQQLEQQREELLEAGFFQMVQPHFSEADPETLENYRLTAPEKMREQVKIDVASGIVSAKPQAINVPEQCRFIQIETSGRVWLATSPTAPNSSQTLQDAVDNRSIAIVGNGYPKTIKKPIGLNTVYISAYPDNTEVTIVFYSGEVKLSDIR